MSSKSVIMTEGNVELRREGNAFCGHRHIIIRKIDNEYINEPLLEGHGLEYHSRP